MKVRFLADVLVRDFDDRDNLGKSRTYTAGCVADLPDGDAGNLVARNLAEEVADEPAPAAPPSQLQAPAAAGTAS